MKPVFIVAAIASLCSTRLAEADDPEAEAGKIYAGGIVIGAIGLVATEVVMLSTDARSATPPTAARSAFELGFDHLAMSIGVGLLVAGFDQHASFFTVVGGGMVAASIPGAAHGLSGLEAGGQGDTDDERRADRHLAGVTEVAFGLPELTIEGIALAASAADPVQHVRTAGVATAAILAIPSAALVIHGFHTLATPESFEHTRSNVMVVPTILGATSGPTVGVGVVGQF